MLRARSLLSRVFVPCSCVFISWFGLVRIWIPLHGAPCFLFYRRRESAGYNGEKGEERERERRRILGSPSPAPLCGSRRSYRCQQGRLHVAALFVTGAMRRRHLLVMTFHSVPAEVQVN